MKHQRNGIALITLLVTVGIVTAFVATAVASFVTNYNYGNRVEQQIVAAWENNENILAQYSLKVAEIGQVTDMQRDDFSKVYKDVMEGRYGENGSQAMFQWLQEQNPQLNAEVYTRLQQVMEAGRNEFRVAQTSLVDLKRGYKTNQGYLWKGLWLRIAGYPKINLDDYKIITSEHAQGAFETGVDKGIKLRKE